MNALTKAADGGALTLESLRQGLAAYRQTKAPVRSGAGFLKLTKQGIWVYGADAVEVSDDSLWVVNPLTIGHGQIAWHQSQVEWETYVPITQPITAHPPAGLKAKNGVEDYRGFDAVCIEGGDEGEQVQYRTSALGGLEAHEKLVADIHARLEETGVGDKFCPVISLGSSSYRHREYGIVHKPAFIIEDWMSLSEATGAKAAAEAEPEAEPEAEAEQAEQGEPEAAADGFRRRPRRA